MDIIIRTNNRAKALRAIMVYNVIYAKTYSFMGDPIDIDDIENIDINEVFGSLTLTGDTNLSIDRDSISSIQVIK
ncbi:MULTISPECIES: hypothetical protein [Convivina]|uniref:Uncharacterized protein n=2 Tax=Convivina TaxID=1697027 RepID=A0A2U1D3H2_9LACO|nr:MULTISPECIES: hypothetical protein [Convivina]SDC22529.1 hypothetical protein SAMN05216341_1252 [Leuconostocaceae bacterium R-53105]PVY82200.1 hypothetical protein C7384_1153 [Convivina intestini]CAH1854529.1 hypothetical protein R077815_01072 [Convivina sp. LMG 32447]CAH1855784.1 hypothetical protein R078138_01210 [Convivina sp. LMG 32447]CAH1855883.1 hypothetical protein LMG032447_01186 [Convivina sp. LMG 32447]